MSKVTTKRNTMVISQRLRRKMCAMCVATVLIFVALSLCLDSRLWQIIVAMQQPGGGELVLFSFLSMLPRGPRTRLMRLFSGTDGENVVYYRDVPSR